ncbi:MAG TPA: polysaccharide deacetylase family protein [Bacillota bacterium]|nr:polysaccharide deacetylase family protein [Bacillota bacterium]
MRIVFMNQKQLRVWILAGIILINVCGLLLNSERVTRRIFGVKSGVWLENRQVAGMLPEELTKLVTLMAERVNRDARDAGYLPETGEILSAQPGKRVQVAETVQQVCLAKAGSRLKLKIVEVAPGISEELFKPVYHANAALPKVALTVNVAWGEEYLPEILRILKEEKAKATFFFVGTWVKAFPELVKEIAASGHEVANHGLYHGHPLQMKREELRRLITENNLLLAGTLGKEPARLFAPPYGEVNSQIAATAGELGYRTIMWSVDTIDWKNPTPETLLNRVLAKIEPGGIILMHPTVASRTALRPLIRALKKRGLQPVTVSELIR